MTCSTADLWDDHGEKCKVLDPLFKDYGKPPQFFGSVRTLKVHEDNSLVRKALEEKSDGEVLVVDGGGSTRCALLGDRLATLGRDNGWAGIVIFGAVRDSAVLKDIEFGVKALCTNPKKSLKRQEGQRDVPVCFGGVEISPGGYLYCDEDGILYSPEALL
jgi:regulator of ribonuclease activity A